MVNIKYDKILGTIREDTEGFDGDLRDGSDTVIATVVRGLITDVVFTGISDFILLQNGSDQILLQSGGTNNVGLQ